MRGGIFSKNIWEGASERRNENIIVWDPKNMILRKSVSFFFFFLNNFIIIQFEFFVNNINLMHQF
jgi:hypothetical protein